MPPRKTMSSRRPQPAVQDLVWRLSSSQASQYLGRDEEGRENVMVSGSREERKSAQQERERSVQSVVSE
jgi:hypothetical protein